MTTLKNTLHDSNNGLDYTLVNDHYLPNLTVVAPTEQHPTGRWGRLHKMYLKEQRPIQYNQLLLSGELDGYLAKLDKQTEEAACIDRPADAGSRGRGRSPESRRSTGVGAPDEQHPKPCRGDHQDRADFCIRRCPR